MEHAPDLEATRAEVAPPPAPPLAEAIAPGLFRFRDQRFERLVESLTDMAGVLDAQGRWVWASPAYRRFRGPGPDRGDTVRRFVHPDDQEIVRLALARVLQGDQAQITATYRAWSGADQRWVWHETTCVDHRDDPLVEGLVLSTRDVTRRVEAEEALRQQALHDSLTGLPNRTLLRDRLESAGTRARRHARPFALLFFDLDHFKEVNDSLGHSAGDVLLVTVAERLRAAVRDEDTLARLGGDEFVLITEELHDRTVDDEVESLCELVSTTVAEPVRLGDRLVGIGASIGVVVSHGYDSVDDVLRDADVAMYEAKDAGRGRWVRHDSWMSERAQAHFEARTLLASAVDGGAVEVLYQPVVALATGEIRGVEALARIRRPDGTLLGADAFIDIAEETGAILELGADVLGQATSAMASLSADWWISVNVSVRQLVDSDFELTVLEMLGRSGLPADRLVLEITETAILGLDHTEAIETVDRLHAEGVRFALDDFGTGFSSVDRLRHLPVEFIKIDRSFIGRVAVIGSGDLAVVKAILGMSGALGLQVIAEGVEDRVQAEVLDHFGIGLAQGYLFGQPQADLSALTVPAVR